MLKSWTHHNPHQVARDAQLGVLKEGPVALMRALNSHMRTHPDSSWQYMCML